MNSGFSRHLAVARVGQLRENTRQCPHRRVSHFAVAGRRLFVDLSHGFCQREGGLHGTDDPQGFGSRSADSIRQAVEIGHDRDRNEGHVRESTSTCHQAARRPPGSVVQNANQPGDSLDFLVGFQI